jgi:hypothetical protein
MKDFQWPDFPIDVAKDYWMRIADSNDEAIKKAIVGSRIASFEVKRIKNRKHMVEVTITIDAPSLVPIIGSRNAFTVINPMIFRVKR